MLNLSYTPIPILQTHLKRIEAARRSILSVPLSISSELRLRFESRVAVTRSVFGLSGHYMKYSDILSIVSDIVIDAKNKKQDAFSYPINRFFQALGFVQYHYLVTNKPITEKEVVSLFLQSCDGDLLQNEKELKQLCEYLAVSSEHPVIQAAVSYLQVLKLVPFSKDNEKIASLFSHAILSKYGHDVRGTIGPEEYWYQNINEYKRNIQNALGVVGMTDWIVFYAKSVSQQLEKVLQSLDSKSISWKTPVEKDMFYLSDRQKKILAFLENPNVSITNKKVQSMFGISQITASRDLSGLEKLGLVFSHGKGRSVFYTRM